MENGNYLKAMHFVSDTAHFHSQVPIPQYCPFCWSLLLLRNAGDVSGSSCMYRGCLTMKLWLYTTLSFTAKTSDPECCGGFWGQVLHQLRKEHPSGQAPSRWVFTDFAGRPQPSAESVRLNYLLPEKHQLMNSVIPLEVTSRYVYWPYNHKRKKTRSKII